METRHELQPVRSRRFHRRSLLLAQSWWARCGTGQGTDTARPRVVAPWAGSDVQNAPESAPHGYPVGLSETDGGEGRGHRTAATAFSRSTGDPPGSRLMACGGSRGGRTPSRSPRPRRREAAELPRAGADDGGLPPFLLLLLLFQRVRAQSLGADAAGGPSGRRLAGRSLGERPLGRPLGRPGGRAPGGPRNKLSAVREACAKSSAKPHPPSCTQVSLELRRHRDVHEHVHTRVLPEHTSTCAHTGARSHTHSRMRSRTRSHTRSHTHSRTRSRTQTRTSLRRRCPVWHSCTHRHSHTRAATHAHTHTDLRPGLARCTRASSDGCAHTHSSLSPCSTHARECLPHAVA